MLPSSKPVAIVLGVLLLTAGCLGGVPSGGPESGTATPTPDPTSTTPDGASATETSPSGATSVGTAGASEQPDPDKEVRVENRWNRSVEIRVRVVREATNETVYDETLSLEPGEERTAYHVADADPDGIESFRVTATARNATESVTIRTNACYGNAYVEIADDGTLYPYYAIC